jgi:hypothetical protein
LQPFSNGTGSPTAVTHRRLPQNVACGFLALRSSDGSVANFVQEVLQGQLPVSVRGLRGQGVELCGRGEALLDPVFQLPFAQQVHQFDADED